jgi:hypothetical protein
MVIDQAIVQIRSLLLQEQHALSRDLLEQIVADEKNGQYYWLTDAPQRCCGGSGRKREKTLR